MVDTDSLNKQICATSPQIRAELGNSALNQNKSIEQGLNLGAKRSSGNQ
jgi:hypothetical protein